MYAGWNPGAGKAKVGANTLSALEREGLVTLAKTRAGETYAKLTKAGWLAAGVEV